MMNKLKLSYLCLSLLTVFTVRATITKESRAITYELSYNVEIPKPDHKFKKLGIWIPVPKDSLEQKVLSQNIQGLTFTIHEEKRYGNKMVYFDVTDQTQFPINLNLKWKVQRKPLNSVHTKTFSKDNDPANFLSMNKKVPINGIIADLANKITSNVDNKWKKTETIYDYVVSTMRYDKSGKGWGEGDAIWACDAKRGNCTDFHSLLVGMARSQKIPAQFQIGLPTSLEGESEIKGYHCWARVYGQSKGWFPVDASESKKEKSPRKYFGSLPANRIHFTTGRDLILSPSQKGEPLNYFIYPYLELDGKPYSEYSKKFFVKTL